VKKAVEQSDQENDKEKTVSDVSKHTPRDEEPLSPVKSKTHLQVPESVDGELRSFRISKSEAETDSCSQKNPQGPPNSRHLQNHDSGMHFHTLR
jgi:hypothetical protein